ncbi:hypothetical protein [Caulobacter sp. DWR1-3-2b1]|uniref:hypothetical protein n=1 Tax=Caulobacter sp. DWR1-3-2b1 TaxID=2804670 RepID=UPI003CF52963
MAIDQIAPLSLALATFLPVLMRPWVVESSELVELRFCSAVSAPALVLIEFIIGHLPFWSDFSGASRLGVLPEVTIAKDGPTALTRGRILKCCFL